MSTAVAVMVDRMKPLPRRHCIAYLRALIRQPALDPRRRAELAALLCAELWHRRRSEGTDMNRPRMPLYVGYLGDTGYLTTTQHGACLLLMMHYCRMGELPDDHLQLSKIAKLPLRTWCDFFYDGWKHKRIDAELERMMRVSAKRVIAGQNGGLGSALARMKLENSARSRSLPLPSIRAIAAPALAHAADHSHSHSHQSLSSAEASSAESPNSQEPPPAGRAQKPAMVVSP